MTSNKQPGSMKKVQSDGQINSNVHLAVARVS